MVANDVLEWELNNINKKIESLKGNNKSIPEDLIQRKQQ